MASRCRGSDGSRHAALEDPRSFRGAGTKSCCAGSRASAWRGARPTPFRAALVPRLLTAARAKAAQHWCRQPGTRFEHALSQQPQCALRVSPALGAQLGPQVRERPRASAPRRGVAQIPVVHERQRQRSRRELVPRADGRERWGSAQVWSRPDRCSWLVLPGKCPGRPDLRPRLASPLGQSAFEKEVDGAWHSGRARADPRRDRVLAAAGYRVLRVAEQNVPSALPQVVARIRAAIQEGRGHCPGWPNFFFLVEFGLPGLASALPLNSTGIFDSCAN
jgi:hypothetical protein